MSEQTVSVPLELAIRAIIWLDHVAMAEGSEDASDVAEQFRALIDARADAIEEERRRNGW